MSFFWDIVWLMCFGFFFIACLMLIFNITADLFRDRDLSGWLKALWIVALILVPLLSSLVYVIARGKGMHERSNRAADTLSEQRDAYLRAVADKAAPAEQIVQGKRMLDDGVIDQAEFEQIKAKALAG